MSNSRPQRDRGNLDNEESADEAQADDRDDDDRAPVEGEEEDLVHQAQEQELLLVGDRVEIEESEDDDEDDEDDEQYQEVNAPPRRQRHFHRWRRWFIRRFAHHDPEDEEPDDNGDLEAPENITFDRNLPTAHSYLGEMEECSGVAYQEEDTYLTMNVLYFPDVVLIPGQNLPLHISRPNQVSMIRQVMQQADKTFGILTIKNTFNVRNEIARKYYNIGCTAEIRSYQDREEYQITVLHLIVVGRQKFTVMKSQNQLDGNILAKVRIESDVELDNLGAGVGMSRNSRNAFITSKKNQPTNMESIHPTLNKTMCLNRHAAMSTSLSSWVYKLYDVDFLRMRIFKELKEWNSTLEQHQMPESATDFSYWVITNFPISDEWKLYLMHLKSAVQRLRCELNLIHKRSKLTCSSCGSMIADRKEVFSMSTSGPMAAYVNPGGAIHETLTLYKASGLSYRGRKSTEFSWFPGYAWTICECSSCGQHLGWKFTATTKHLIPQKFWGLTRYALSLVLSSSKGGPTRRESDEQSEFDPRSMTII
ncbi:protein cereblon-like isoform X1 [Clavelina lepadiformis]|uniref:protein cereblon-like isoform X1 n=1 Tax=Clavelina lepadiformis TaxID=159417 RepID=UPI00404186B3